MDNIVLIGMPTSGKSTVGVIVAKIFGMDFIDTDIVIQKREGARLCEIIEKRGLEAFMKCEEQALLSVNAEHTVIATGGSAVYSRAAMEHLKKSSRVVYLKVEKEELFKRLKEIKERGVVLRNGETLEEMYDERAMLYTEFADIVISEENRTLEETVSEVVLALREGRETEHVE